MIKSPTFNHLKIDTSSTEAERVSEQHRNNVARLKDWRMRYLHRTGQLPRSANDDNHKPGAA